MEICNGHRVKSRLPADQMMGLDGPQVKAGTAHRGDPYFFMLIFKHDSTIWCKKNTIVYSHCFEVLVAHGMKNKTTIHLSHRTSLEHGKSQVQSYRSMQIPQERPFLGGEK